MCAKKILHLAIEYPYPADAGHKIRIYENIAALAELGEVWSVSFTSRPVSSQDVRELEALPGSVRVVPPVSHHIQITRKPFDLLSAISRGIIHRIPYVVVKFASSAMKRVLAGLLAEQKFDVIIFDQLRTTGYFDLIRELSISHRPKYILETHNVEADLWQQYYEQASSPIKRFYAGYQKSITGKWEMEMIARMDITSTISDLDREHLIRMGADSRKLITLPVSVGPRLKLKSTYNLQSKNLLFIGGLAWEPNLVGLKWFVDKVYPLVRRELPEIPLVIAGSGPFQHFPEPINNLGYVEDINPLYLQAAIFIVPILRGSGVRLKIFDAMKRGIPVVSTSIGASGINLQHGKHIYLADTEEEFARGIVALIRDENRRRQLSQESFRFVS